MKRNILSSLVLAFIAISLYSQDPNILWQRTIGGSDYDYLTSMIETNDGGLLLAGTSDSNISGEKNENSKGEEDCWIIKLNEAGEIEWQNTIGGDFSDGLPHIIQTNDGGFLLAASSHSNISGDKTENSRGASDYWILKLSPEGSIEWQRTIGGNGYDYINSFSQATDGNYFIGGFSDSSASGEKTESSLEIDYWIIKIDNFGNILWQNTIGGNFNDILNYLYPTADGGCIVGGESNSNISGDKTENAIENSLDYWVLKLAVDGTIEWQNTIGGSLSDQLTFLLQTTEGEYLIGGDSISNISGDKSENCKGYSDIWLLKLDESGEIIWQKTIGGSNIDHLKYIIKKNQGNYILIGDSLSDISGDKTENSHGLNDYWVIEIEEGGNILWQNTIGGDARDEVSSTIISSANEIIIGGSSKSNNSGDKTENSRGDFDFWIVKHAQTLGLEENPFTTAITIYPNPTKNTLQLNTQDKTIDQINIYTITGSKVLQLDVDIVSPTVDVSSLASGVYYVQLYSGKNVALKKFVKE